MRADLPGGTPERYARHTAEDTPFSVVLAPGPESRYKQRVNRAQDLTRDMLFVVAAVVAVAVLWAVRDVVILGAFAVLLAYALDPLVGFVQRVPFPRGQRLSREFASGLVVYLLVVVVVWLAVLTVPRLAAELGGFLQRVPESVELLLIQARRWADARGFAPYFDPALASLHADSGTLVRQAVALAAGWIGKGFGNLIQIFGLLVLPLLAFYLLAEREDVRASVLRFVPHSAHPQLQRAAGHVDRALQSYVRGQALVCAVVGATMAAALTALGFPLALLLGVVAGLAEVVPYMGAAITAVAIALVGLGGGWQLAALGVGAYLIINNLVGFLVTPQVMSRHLKMHPFVVTMSILAGASLLGPAGALLAIPGAAIAQALVAAFAPPRETRRADSGQAGPGPEPPVGPPIAGR
jgi:predicted PurR-regulated permease PerM